MPGLFHAPSGKSYGVGRERDFLADLDAHDRSTMVVEPTRWQDLSLGADGATPDGWRFTQSGLVQLCAALAPGLGRLVLELSGSLRGPHDPTDGFSLSEAIAIYNMVLRRRFSSCVAERCRLIKDRSARSIDGVSAAKGGFLGNRTVVRRALDAASKSGRDLVFFEGSRLARRVSLRLLDRKAAAGAPDGSTWHTGWWIAHCEDGDAASLVGSRLLGSPKAGLSMLGPPLKPSGRAGGRLDSLLDALAADAPRVDRLSAALAQLGAARRELPADASARVAAVSRLASRLVRRGVPVVSARKAVVAASLGSAPSEADLAVDFAARGGGRVVCGLPLMESLSRMAKAKHAALRERLERAAYSMLINQKGLL